MSWRFHNKIIKKISDLPEDTYGFIYVITNINKDRYYVGKKSLKSYRWVNIAKSTYEKDSKNPLYRKTKDRKKSKKGKPVWIYKKLVIKETDWLKYTGSCKELNDDIKAGDIVHKEIIDLAKDKKMLTYLEVKHQFKYDVLESDKWYNTNILGKFFRVSGLYWFINE